jgi:hypothetical protein
MKTLVFKKHFNNKSKNKNIKTRKIFHNKKSIKIESIMNNKTKTYIDMCLAKLKYKNKCNTGFNNTLGTCWYSSILSILFFSDAIGKRFLKALFEMNEVTINDKVKNLKELRKKYDFPTLKGSDLDGIPQLIQSLKIRIHKTAYKLKDIKEEDMCYIINRQRHMEGWFGMKEHGEAVFSSVPLLKPYLLNTFTFILLDELYDYKLYDYNLPPLLSENIIAYFVDIDITKLDSHISSIYKYDNQYIHQTDNVMKKINKEINEYLNSKQIILDSLIDQNIINKINIDDNKKRIHYITLKMQYDITKNKISIEKQQIYMFVEEIEKGKKINIKLYDKIVKSLNEDYPTCEGQDLIMWAIIYNNINALIQLLDYYNDFFIRPASDIQMFVSFHKSIEIFKYILERPNYINEIDINEKNLKGNTILMEVILSKNIDIKTKKELIVLLKKKGAIIDNAIIDKIIDKYIQNN